MSSTNRGGQRSPADFYPPPGWCVHRLLDELLPPGQPYRGQWVEPCAGSGAIIRAVTEWSAGRDPAVDIGWTANELADRPTLRLLPGVELYRGDTLAWVPETGRFDMCLTNPPFSSALRFVKWGLEHANTTAMLLRINFLASARRAEFMRAHPPDVYVLPNRPSFTGRGTDSIDYAWFVWRSPARRRAGRIMVLEDTPKIDRVLGQKHRSR